MTNNYQDIVIKKLEERGVKIDDIAKITYDLQAKYHHNLDFEYCKNTIYYILGKREVINAVLTGIAIDEAAEKHLFDKEINDIILNDHPLYGIDEILALSIVNIAGSIALTNFGYVDKVKPGIIKEIDVKGKEDKNYCSTFLDDLIGAIAAAAASKIAHEKELNC